jgi:Tol biopolymer transport system component
MPGPSLASRGAAIAVGAWALAALSGCTLTAGEFEPLLVSGGDAGALSLLEADAGLPPPPSGEACAREAAASCSVSIGLFEPSALDAGPALASPAPSLSLSPCPDGFGEFGAPEELVGFEFDDVYGPSLSSDGRTLFFSAYVDGEQQIYSATRAARGAPFSNFAELPVVNSTAMDGSPFISAEGQRLYFFSERPPGAPGRRDIWVSERDGEGFGAPALVLGVNSASSELLPWLTPDELTLLFVSGRPGGSGGADVWRATRRSISEPFGEPSSVSDLSSSANEGRAVLSADGVSAFFTSDRAGGSPDIWTATRQGPGGEFGEPRRLALQSSDATELDVMISSDGAELLFASTRSGRSSLYRAERGCR